MQNKYKKMMEHVAAPEGLIEETINASVPAHRACTGHKRTAVVFAIIVLCIALAIPVMAATPGAYDMLYAISPSVAQLFVPIRESDESNGICMEVLSAYVHEDMAEIYIAMTDLTDDRIDETIDLFDSYSIHRGFDSSATCRLAEFDPDTGTAIFYIMIQQMNGKEIAGEKLTFSVREFISRGEAMESVPLTLGWSLAEPDAETIYTEFSGMSGDSAMNCSGNVLKPSGSMLRLLSTVDITGMGFVDDKLHIQLATEDKFTYDSHGYLYLVDSQGNRLYCDYSVSFIEGAGEERMDYEELVFDVSPEKLSDYTVFGSFWTHHMRTEGNWRVTFQLEDRL